MKSIKKNKRIVEGASSGYNMEGSLVKININSLKPKVLDDGSISFTCDIDCIIKDTIVSSYYNSAQIYGGMRCKIVSGIDYHYSLEGLEGEELAEALAEDLAYTLDNLQFESETNGGGWDYHKFDGKFSIESNYLDLNCKVVNKVSIELIDKINRGYNYQFEVYDDVEGKVAVFESDEEEYAIEYAKKYNCSSVKRVYLNYILHGGGWDDDPRHGDEFVVWENDSTN